MIQTKIAGATFNLDIVAINPTRTGVYTTFTGTVTVQLLNSSNNSRALGANGCRSTWATIGSSANVTFAAANSGRVRTTFSASDAWPDVRAQITYTKSGTTVTSCSTDDLAIRPAGLAL